MIFQMKRDRFMLFIMLLLLFEKKKYLSATACVCERARGKRLNKYIEKFWRTKNKNKKLDDIIQSLESSRLLRKEEKNCYYK